MEDMIPCSIKNQEVFRRVWQRVMAGRDDAQCPLEALPPKLQGDLSCDCLKALAQSQGPGIPEECKRQSGAQTPVTDSPEQEQPAPVPPVGQPVPELPMDQLIPVPPMEQPAPVPPIGEPAPVPPAPECPEQDQPVPECPASEVQMDAVAVSETLPEADGPSRGSDMPRLWEEPQESNDRTARLRRQVMEALEGWQFYRYLARKARPGDARVLNSMAGEMHRIARKLSAAYFLLTGLRYWPSELLSAPAIPSYWGALRARHQAEQRQEMAFRMSADDWDDPDMRELYESLIEDGQRRSRQLRNLLEQDVS